MENLTIIDTILPLDLKVKYLSEIFFCTNSHNLKFSMLKVFSFSTLIMTQDEFYWMIFAKN